ncbi:centrosomal protein of 128 kDa [Rhipicephalus sanguineus]|nr:centrosomal protein of 128 kDa [Rhipicephalus sanguineus]
MASLSEKRLLVGFDDLGIPDWTQVEFLTFSREIRLCSLCGVVSASTATVGCQHVLCSFCFRDQGEGPSIVCPIDKVETSTSKAKFERNNTELLLSLRVACVNRRNGCRLLDTLRGMKDHLKQCEFQAVQCQMCGKKIKLHEVPGHARKDCSRIPKSENSKRAAAAPAAQPAVATMRTAPPKSMGEQTTTMGQMQGQVAQTAPPQVMQAQAMPPQMVMQPMSMTPQAMMTQHLQAAPVVMQQAPWLDEVATLQQKVNKVHEDVRKMATRMQALKDETARELDIFKKELQKMKNEKGDYSMIVNGISGLRSQMKDNMVDVTDEFDAIKEEMRLYGASIEDLGALKETMEMRIGDIVQHVESLKESVDAYANLSTTVTEMKTSIAAIQDMKHVMEFVSDFEQTLLGDITGSSGDKKKAFTQQVEMLKKCVEVIDELKSTVKLKDMEQVVNELSTIKDDLGKYSALNDKVEGISSDLTGLKAVVKEAGDFARSNPALTREYRTELEGYRAEVKLIQEKMQKIGTDIDHLKSTSDDTKDKVGLDEVVAEVSNLKMKFEDFDAIEESLQETKDGFLRINVLSVELDKIREKIDKLEQSEVMNKDTAKKLEEATTQLSSMQTVNESIQRLQNSLQTLNKRFIRKTEELQASIGATVSEKLEASEKFKELAEVKATIAEVKKDVQLLNDLKDTLSTKSGAKQEGLADVVKDLKTLKASMQTMKESTASIHEKVKHFEELRKSVDAMKKDMKDYQEFKTNFASLKKTVEERLKSAED